MRRFAELFQALESSNRTSERLQALVGYFQAAEAEDAAWALALLTGHRRRRYIPAPVVRRWAAAAAGVPEWLFVECYDAVGDLSETVSLLVAHPGPPQSSKPLARWMAELQAQKTASPEAQQEYLTDACAGLSRDEVFLVGKLIGGSFRVGVSTQLALRALAQCTAVPETLLAHRLMGDWQPTAAFFTQLSTSATPAQATPRPYPFCLAHPLEIPPPQLGPRTEWQAEWKWDGIRAQLVCRPPVFALWSRGEELLTERFPELQALRSWLPPGTVLDGELLPWADNQPLPFTLLQQRIGRKNLTDKILRTVPVKFLVYDLLEWDGQDIRPEALALRRERLASWYRELPPPLPLILSETLTATSWDELAHAQVDARRYRAEGLMLKHIGSPYAVGRPRGLWWKWKLSPLCVDAVLVYAQRGTGRRASLYTDYTFAVWDTEADPPQLVPFAKAYSGLTDAEILRVDAFVRRYTRERFGPVRTVEPRLVFEIGFEGIQVSTRHRSGVAVRFPRILRWREDKSPAEADTRATLWAFLRSYGRE